MSCLNDDRILTYLDLSIPEIRSAREISQKIIVDLFAEYHETTGT